MLQNASSIADIVKILYCSPTRPTSSNGQRHHIRRQTHPSRHDYLPKRLVLQHGPCSLGPRRRDLSTGEVA